MKRPCALTPCTRILVPVVGSLTRSLRVAAAAVASLVERNTDPFCYLAVDRVPAGRLVLVVLAHPVEVHVLVMRSVVVRLPQRRVVDGAVGLRNLVVVGAVESLRPLGRVVGERHVPCVPELSDDDEDPIVFSSSISTNWPAATSCTFPVVPLPASRILNARCFRENCFLDSELHRLCGPAFGCSLSALAASGAPEGAETTVRSAASSATKSACLLPLSCSPPLDRTD